MRQLLILSGKGGTGKTTLASSFILLSSANAYADCDVEAPNLQLVTRQHAEPRREDYFGLPKARINAELCIRCARCRQYCRFEAVSEDFRIDPYACEGCGVCQAVCPAGAVASVPAAAGESLLYVGDDRVFSTAKLKMGAGTSGKLVSEVKRNLRKAAAPTTELAVIDGAPGIGCPVIASMSGVDMVLIVAEPSISGISAMARIVKTAETFRTRTAVCINKYDVCPAKTKSIEEYCREKALPLVGKIPFDPCVVMAVNSGKTVAEYDCPAGKAVREVFRNTLKLLPGWKDTSDWCSIEAL